MSTEKDYDVKLTVQVSAKIPVKAKSIGAAKVKAARMVAKEKVDEWEMVTKHDGSIGLTIESVTESKVTDKKKSVAKMIKNK